MTPFLNTKQVVVNGRDWRGWPTLPAAGAAPARASIALQRRGGQVQVNVAPGPGAPAQLGLWWALLEDGHGSAVSRVTVDPSAYTPPPLVVPAKGEGGRTARLLVVVTDAATGAPLQAAQLVCPGAA